MDAKSQELGTDLENETFVESLVTKIVDNLQVTIKNIHLKYEDDSVLTETPYSIGFTLDELSAVSTDEDWHLPYQYYPIAYKEIIDFEEPFLLHGYSGTELYSNLDREEMHDAFQKR